MFVPDKMKQTLHLFYSINHTRLFSKPQFIFITLEWVGAECQSVGQNVKMDSKFISF